jgi:tetratricopeptide (TPR) repeat protein
MEQNSNQFDKAFGLLNSKAYLQAIELFLEDVKINPKNIASYNNIGIAETYLGIANSDIKLLESAIKNFQIAIDITNELQYKDGYPSAQGNLEWAKNEITKMTK